eukprot:CAMPEP_0194261890 /NCGR_PEP_ID=MMETSP0158-20130606/46256_1 /TAXON_ID=33649 /ORGANISM="Thalassionema nitzschioides, Strain L26-B" /LENGTH=459 /DNA_ID=CAMNT_0039002023 /DNA_START=842 /DNA_END=2221 /DNA_ORIENTATION=-
MTTTMTTMMISIVLLLLTRTHAFMAIPPIHTSSSTTASSTTSSSSRLYNNIVLEPSTDPKKFDSRSIGTARIHRYIRDDASDAEYVMWYHARGQELHDSDNLLPPISTGCIGRATSNNGLIWEKCALGSGSEEEDDVSLGPNKESWWGFDTAHVGLGQVMLPMSTPAVLAEGGVYLMYFMGGSHEETKVSDYTSAELEGDAKIKGMSFKVGICMSQDGLTWGRVEGDDPTGAIVVPTNYDDPNSMTQSETKLEEELYVGWPDVMVNTETTNVLSVNSFESNSDSEKKPPAFYMYYSTMLKKCKTKAIAYAVSDDGFRWVKKGTCLKPTADGKSMDSAGCARGTVVRNQVHADGTWKNAPGWTMYYEGVSPEDNRHRILSATSDDCMNWTKSEGVVLDIGDDWDSEGVGSPNLLRLDDGTIRMYYTGQGANGRTAIGIASATAEEPTKFLREQVQFPSLA